MIDILGLPEGSGTLGLLFAVMEPAELFLDSLLDEIIGGLLSGKIEAETEWLRREDTFGE